jgi:hypothetical protein
MGVCVDKKTIQIFVHIFIDIYDFFLHMVHEKKCKKTNLSHIICM